jgi:hypothetical protein
MELNFTAELRFELPQNFTNFINNSINILSNFQMSNTSSNSDRRFLVMRDSVWDSACQRVPEDWSLGSWAF